VRLFLGDAETGQEFENCFGLDLKFAGQFVDADLHVLGHERQ
jgi:hypothetical protein